MVVVWAIIAANPTTCTFKFDRPAPGLKSAYEVIDALKVGFGCGLNDLSGPMVQYNRRFLRQAQDRFFDCAVRKVREPASATLRIEMTRLFFGSAEEERTTARAKKQPQVLRLRPCGASLRMTIQWMSEQAATTTATHRLRYDRKGWGTRLLCHPIIGTTRLLGLPAYCATRLLVVAEFDLIFDVVIDLVRVE